MYLFYDGTSSSYPYLNGMFLLLALWCSEYIRAITSNFQSTCTYLFYVPVFNTVDEFKNYYTPTTVCPFFPLVICRSLRSVHCLKIRPTTTISTPWLPSPPLKPIFMYSLCLSSQLPTTSLIFICIFLFCPFILLEWRPSLLSLLVHCILLFRSYNTTTTIITKKSSYWLPFSPNSFVQSSNLFNSAGETDLGRRLIAVNASSYTISNILLIHTLVTGPTRSFPLGIS